MRARALVIIAALLLISRSSGAGHALNFQQGAKLVGTGAVGNADQGYAVAMSADGNTAIVGGFTDNSGAGAAWVYTRSGGVWSQQGAKLVGSGAVGAANQGYSVAMSGDGNTAIVGGYFDNSNAGAAWVYTRSGGVWSQQGAKLVGTGAVGAAHQGSFVAMSADGSTAIVGGYFDNSNAGAAWMYTRSGGVWSQQGAKLVGTGAVGAANQGISVAMSADGNSAIVGGYSDNTSAGAAWVYTRSGGVWSQQGAKLVGTGAVGAAFQGYSVAMSANGNTAIVGGFNDNSVAGAAWVYARSGGVWSQQGAKLVGTGAVGPAGQGVSVAMSADGNAAIVGGYHDNSIAGASWVYTRSGGVWSQQGAKLVGADAVGPGDQGFSVAMSADGNTAIVGGFRDNSFAGAAWVFINAHPAIATIADVPNDQGGKVSLRWTASLADNVPGNPIDAYWIWRQVPIHQALSAPTSAGRAIRTSVEAGQIYYWEYVGSQVAHGFPAYSYTAPTTADSVPGSNPYTLFMVEAEQLSSGLYWSSDPDSGYSVDNLPPGPPAPITAAYQGGATHLDWGVSPEADFAVYRIYKGASPGFVPGPGNLLAANPETGFVDPGPAGSYYKLSAVDAHGNESEFALVTPTGTVGVEGGGPPTFAIDRVVNPSLGGRLIVSFSLPSSDPARLELLDVSGREAAERNVGALGAGRHTIDFGAAQRLSAGIYFVRLTQGAHVARARVAVID